MTESSSMAAVASSAESEAGPGIRRLCIIGAGLIGGSFARALREAGAVQEIIAYSRNEAHLKQAVALGVADEYSTDLATAVKTADFIFVSVPLSVIPKLLPEIARHRPAGSVVTDAGSAKLSVIAAAKLANQGEMPAWFVPGHPIAGTEQSGVAASFATLFCEHRVILTPSAETDPQALRRVTQAWALTGAQVTEMTADHHDEVLAATSHLPHVLAYGLVDTLAQMADRREIFAYAAGGFRDFTRIAASDPLMWRDICLSNRESLLSVLDAFTTGLASLREQIANGDDEALLSTFTRARAARLLAVERMAAGRPNPNE